MPPGWSRPATPVDPTASSIQPSQLRAVLAPHLIAVRSVVGQYEKCNESLPTDCVVIAVRVIRKSKLDVSRFYAGAQPWRPKVTAMRLMYRVVLNTLSIIYL